MRFSAFVALAALAVQSTVAVKLGTVAAAKAAAVEIPPLCGVSEPGSLFTNPESSSFDWVLPFVHRSLD